jgi:4-amino-4-deoxy-L-arabinose transferase-like glycosyltransferase
MKLSKLKSIIPLAILINIIFIFILVLTSTITNMIEFLINAIPVTLIVNFTLFLGFVFVNRKNISAPFSNITKKTWIALLLILIIAGCLRFFIAPQTHRLYFDEDIYMNIGQNILKEGKAMLCNRGDLEKCYEYILNKQPNGLPFIASLVFLFTGVNEYPVFILTALLSTLSVLLLFLITYILTKNEKISFYAALLFALAPIHIRWGGTVAAGPVFLFFSLFAILFFMIYFHSKSLLLLSFITLAFAVQFRPESYLLVIIVAVAFLLFSKWTEIVATKKFLLAIAIFSLLITPMILQTNAVFDDPWGSNAGKFGLQYFIKNTADNTLFFFENQRYPVFFSVLSLVGFFSLLHQKDKKIIFLLSWFFAFFIIYLLFHAGSFNYGVDDRFSLNLLPASIIFSAIGIEALSRKVKLKGIVFDTVLIIIILIVLSFLWLYPYTSSVGQKANVAREQHKFAYETYIPENCYVMTHVPSMFLVIGRPSLQTWFGQNNNIMDWVYNRTDCVLFYEAYWCGSEPYKSSVCKHMHDNYKLEVYAKKNLGSRNLTFYRVERSI